MHHMIQIFFKLLVLVLHSLCDTLAFIIQTLDLVVFVYDGFFELINFNLHNFNGLCVIIKYFL